MTIFALESAYSTEVSVFVEDVVAPNPITGLIIQPNPLGGVVALNWTNPADSDLADVEIHRSDTPPAPVTPSLGTLIHQGEIINSYSDTNVTNGTTYYYSIFTKDAAGNYSIPVSGEATPNLVFLPPTIYPPAPQVGGVYLSWQSIPYVDGYRIYYGTTANPSSYATPLNITTSSLSDPLNPDQTILGLTNGQTYYFEICAYFGANNTGMNEVSAAIGLLPAANVYGTYDPDIALVTVYWDSSESITVDKYFVYYKIDPMDITYSGAGLQYGGNLSDSPITVMVSDLTDPGAPSIDLADAVLETPYWFKIVAADASNNTSPAAIGTSNVTPHAGAAPGAAFASPRNINAQIVQSNKQITISWDPI